MLNVGYAALLRWALVVGALGAGVRCSPAAGDGVVAAAPPPSNRDMDWHKSAPLISRGAHQPSAGDVFESSGASKGTDVEDAAVGGFGPDDEDSEIGSGSPVDMIESSGDEHHPQPIDYDDYPKTDWIEMEETTVHSATDDYDTDTTTRTVTADDVVDWNTPNVHSSVGPKLPEEHSVPMGKAPTEEESIWSTMTTVPTELFTETAVVITTPTTAIGATTTTTKVVDFPERTNIFGSRNQGRFDSLWRPGILAAVIGGSVLGLLAAVMLITFIVYRMRKKDEGSYALDESKTPPAYPYAYHKAPTREFYA